MNGLPGSPADPTGEAGKDAGEPHRSPPESGHSNRSGRAAASELRKVLVVGAGLIGTSIALALRESAIDVALDDTAPGRLALAVELGAGRPVSPGEQFDLAVVAVPPGAVAGELLRLQQLDIAVSYTDVASVKAEPQREAEAIGVDMGSYIGSHPIAGRERSGPAAAHGDLFAGRPWVITETPSSSPVAVAAVGGMISACGGVPVRMSADEHDAALAAVSHLPHLVASLLAGQLVDLDEATVGLSGTGLHDTTRVAAGDARLWTQILSANAAHLAAALGRYAEAVRASVEALERIARGDADAARMLTSALEAGMAGRARVPVKRGQPAAGFATVPVVIRDRPGELAALLRALGDAGINVEDVRVEHEPGRPLGVAELDVREDAVSALVARVRESGWQLYD